MEKVITGCVCHGISAQSLVTLERKKKKEKQNHVFLGLCQMALKV